MSKTPNQHYIYSKSPELFMMDNWITFDAFNGYRCDRPVTPFKFQTEFITQVHEEKALLVVKSRQMHVSSMMALYMAWYVLFNPEKSVAIISHSLESSREILFKVKIILQNYSVNVIENGKIIEHIFNWEDDFVINNKTTLQLKNGSRIKASSPTITACRGEMYDFAFIDECAYIPNFSEFYMALLPCLMAKKNSKLVMSSAPKDNSEFNKFVLNANGFKFLKLHWSIHPVYNIDLITNEPGSDYAFSSSWFQDVCKHLNYKKESINQELECIINYKEQTNKSQTISLRIEHEMYKKIQSKLKENESASDYIRNLIEKDLS
jgi:hypothetical protein